MISKRNAFTLVEIMIVVAIIALVAAIAIPNLLRAKITANNSSAQATLKSIATALETYYATNSSYPTDSSSLVGATPPYLNTDYCATTVSGFIYDCTLNDYSYTIVASPVSLGRSGSTTYTIVTGGIFQ